MKFALATLLLAAFPLLSSAAEFQTVQIKFSTPAAGAILECQVPVELFRESNPPYSVSFDCTRYPDGEKIKAKFNSEKYSQKNVLETNFHSTSVGSGTSYIGAIEIDLPALIRNGLFTVCAEHGYYDEDVIDGNSSFTMERSGMVCLEVPHDKDSGCIGGHPETCRKD